VAGGRWLALFVRKAFAEAAFGVHVEVMDLLLERGESDALRVERRQMVVPSLLTSIICFPGRSSSRWLRRIDATWRNTPARQ